MRNSRQTKTLNFKHDVSSPPPSQKKSRIRGAYNFNKSDISDDQSQNLSTKLGNQSFFKTTDSLNNQSFEDHKSKPQKNGLSQFQNQSKTGGILVKLPLQKEQKIPIITQSLAQQVEFVEKLFLNILQGSQQQQFKQLVANRKTTNAVSVKEQALLFLSLDNFIKQRRNYQINDSYSTFYKLEEGLIPNKEDSLKRWAIYYLRNRKQFTKLASDKQVSQQWMLLASGKINQLANKFIEQGNYEQAIFASNIQDKSFIESFQFSSSTLLKKQSNILQSRDITITPKLVWPVDFAISLMYFEQSQLEQYIQDIFKKYHNSLQTISPALEPALLALTVAYSKQKLNQKMIEKIVSSEKRFNYLRQVLFLYSLKDNQKMYQSTVKKITENLITLLHNPKIFIELLIFQKLPEDKIRYYLNFYLSKNKPFLDQKQKRLRDFYQAINQKSILYSFQSQQFLAIKILYQWKICEEYLKISSQKKYFQSLKFFINNIEQIKSSKTHEYKRMVASIIKNLVRFQLACTYKQESRRAYYRQLQNLHNIIEIQYQKNIVLGCMAYLQLKFNIFWFYQPRKLNNMYQFYLFLKKSSSEHTYFITNIRKTLQATFNTLQGKLYLTELATRYQSKEREEYAMIIKKQAKNHADLSQSGFRKVQFFKILDMLNWNSKIANFIVIKLLFH